MERMTNRRRAADARGFTLVELLIVIAILGVLAAAFLPDILGAQESANDVATTANLDRLAKACETFQRAHGYYPPDDLQDPEGKLEFKSDNGLNTGIESLLAFVSQSNRDGTDLSDLGILLINSDADKGEMMPLLSRSDRVEVADAWGTPIVYFSKTSRSGGFGKPQTVSLPLSGQTVEVRARLNAEGLPIGGRKFQLLSAGKDLEFGTADDISYPAR
jgi:prepilin-type N-terminal cleavage/methylation domain-containing protein